MGKRTRDEVIYSRVDGHIKGEFTKQMEESGYKNSGDFIGYLLGVNMGMQIGGVTLKQFIDVMKEVAHELKKAGVNINQMTRLINAFPDMASVQEFCYFEKAYSRLEKTVLALWEKVV